MGKFKDLTDQRFGRLIARKVIGRNKHGHIIWECDCDCTNTLPVSGNDLKSGNTKSCGCYKNELSAIYSMRKAKTKEKKTSIYKGVSWNKAEQIWKAQICFKGKHILIGRYHDETLAAREYNIKATELFGDNAWLNPI